MPKVRTLNARLIPISISPTHLASLRNRVKLLSNRRWTGPTLFCPLDDRAHRGEDTTIAVQRIAKKRECPSRPRSELFSESDCDTLLPLNAGFRGNGIRLRRFSLLNGCHPEISCDSSNLSDERAGVTPWKAVSVRKRSEHSGGLHASREAFSVKAEPAPVFRRAPSGARTR